MRSDLINDKLNSQVCAADEQRFRELANAMPQIAWSSGPDGSVEFVNDRWYEYTGFDGSMPPAEQYDAAVHPDDMQRLQKDWQSAFAAGLPLEAEVRFRSKTGEYRWHLARQVPFRDDSGAIIRWYGTSTDVHDYKLARDELARSERRFRVALSGAQVTAYEQDENLRYTWLYPEEPYPHSMGRTDLEILGNRDGQRLTEIKSRVLQTGKGVRETIRADIRGTVHFFDLMVEPLCEQDRVVGVTGAALDISHRRRAEEALRESEERFRKAIENSPLPKIIHAEDGEIIYASHAWIDAVGFAPREAPTVDEWVAKVGEKAGGLADAFYSVFGQEQSPQDAPEFTIRARTGRELIWMITSAPLGVLPDGRRLAVSAGIDITSRKWTEEGQRFLTNAGRALAESLDYEKTLATIARLAVPVLADWCAVDVLNSDGGVKRLAVAHVDPEKVKWAKELQEKYPVDMNAPTGVPNVLRTGKSEVIGEVTAEMIEAANLSEELLDVVRKAEISSMVISPLIARDKPLGAITFVSSVPGRYEQRDVAIFEELGRIAGLAIENARLYSSIQDELAERKRAEAEVLELNESLNERVNERTEELKAANKEMEGFTYSVSHDLRAPLRAIMATSMILLDEVGPSLGPSEREMLQRQAAAAKKMGVLIDELLKLSRLSRQEMQVESVDLTLLAEDVAADLHSDGNTNSVHFAIEDGLAARGDARLLRFVLLNLMENAAKFSPKGGTVSVGKENGAFFVRDQGIGFEMAYVDKLFLPFERLVSDTDYPGTGIGLANVQRIVQRHNGRVWAESEPGKGATFWFTLPS